MESRTSPLYGGEPDSAPHEPRCGLSADRNYTLGRVVRTSDTWLFRQSKQAGKCADTMSIAAN
jgi:hypothetical protein